jgi:8-amino-3,8-dideoxy-alpha-D-manno-octulosonate transaminase
MPGYELLGAEELTEVTEVFSRGGVLFRHGFDNLRNNCYKVKEFENAFAAKFGAKGALAVTSGTAALRVAIAALEIGPGDEIITQTFTFVATVESIIESGATPICAEIDDTLNMDPSDLEKKISKKTKAVIVVHMLGVPARLREIVQICKRHGIPLIEDTAWGCGGALDGKPLGTWGDIGTFSFDYAKIITTGEGGMLLTNDLKLHLKAAAWHDHGHENNPSVPRWEDTRSSSGFNYRMMELQGAIGLAQLKKLDFVVKSQRENMTLIRNEIEGLNGVKLRKIIDGAYETADALVIFLETIEQAKRCREALLHFGLSTKILPEAYSWHFAGTWGHMPELVSANGGHLESSFKQSKELLRRAVALPIKVKMEADTPTRFKRALKTVI